MRHFACILEGSGVSVMIHFVLYRNVNIYLHTVHSTED